MQRVHGQAQQTEHIIFSDQEVDSTHPQMQHLGLQKPVLPPNQRYSDGYSNGSQFRQLVHGQIRVGNVTGIRDGTWEATSTLATIH